MTQRELPKLITAGEAKTLTIKYSLDRVDWLWAENQKCITVAASEGRTECRMILKDVFDKDIYDKVTYKAKQLGFTARSCQESDDGPSRPGYYFIHLSWGNAAADGVS